MLKMKLKPPVGGGKSLILSRNHLFNWFVRTADSFLNEASDCLCRWVIMNHWLTRFTNTTVFAFRDEQWLSFYFIWNYFRWWYRVKSCSTCLLNCCIKSISHLQTPLIIIKSCYSPYRDLWAHRKWERVSELSRLKSTCKCDTFRRNLREWV